MAHDRWPTGHYYTFPLLIRQLMADPANAGQHWLLDGMVYCHDTRESFKADRQKPPRRCRYCKRDLSQVATLAA
ncbi:MAG: hypothetical protein HY567_04095 [Candidatus Kerfeldbacteria bacterium]|nr:hypothetical protein [Candidatus Kerfeldbacteria bacterium]